MDPSMPTTIFAHMLFTHDELKLLADEIDHNMKGMPMRHPRWSKLNSIRTALREAQYSLEIPTHDD